MKLVLVLSLITLTASTAYAQNMILNKDVDKLLNNTISALASGEASTVKEHIKRHGGDKLKIIIDGNVSDTGKTSLKLSLKDANDARLAAPFFDGGMPFNTDTHIARDNRSAGGRFQIITFKKTGEKENELINNQTNCAFTMALDAKRVLRLNKFTCTAKANSIILPDEDDEQASE